MRRNKVGSLFLVSVLALAGIGISYAGFSDQINVYGTVNTATVHLDVMTNWYSGTWVYKIYGFEETQAPSPAEVNTFFNVAGLPDILIVYQPENEILIVHGFVNQLPSSTDVIKFFEGVPYNGKAMLVSDSYATTGGTPIPGDGTSDVNMVYDNLFPCIGFSADFVFHYTGTIPAKINTATIFPITESLYDNSGVGFLTYLWNYHATHPDFGAWVDAWLVTPIFGTDGTTIIGWTHVQTIDVGYQLHDGDYVWVVLTIHLPQDNDLQGMSGTFGGKIGVIQWNEG